MRNTVQDVFEHPVALRRRHLCGAFHNKRGSCTEETCKEGCFGIGPMKTAALNGFIDKWKAYREQYLTAYIGE